MTDQPPLLEFSAILGRVARQDDAIELRLYPNAFSAAPDAKDVLVATFSDPHFEESDIAPLVGDEVEGTVFNDRVEITSVFEARSLTLRARQIRSEWRSYDAADFVRRVDELDRTHERINAALTKAVQKNRNAISLAQELLRRANIKAQSSTEHAEKQASAISVLKRLLRQLESEP